MKLLFNILKLVAPLFLLMLFSRKSRASELSTQPLSLEAVNLLVEREVRIRDFCERKQISLENYDGFERLSEHMSCKLLNVSKAYREQIDPATITDADLIKIRDEITNFSTYINAEITKRG